MKRVLRNYQPLSKLCLLGLKLRLKLGLGLGLIPTSTPRLFTLGLALVSAIQTQSVLAQAHDQHKPLLLASIKPLALIAQEIAGDNIQVDTLLPVTASPHDHPLKVSDHKRLHQADVIIWVGAELESFLAKPLKNIPAHKKVSAYQLAGLHWPGSVANTHDNHRHAHTHQGLDPHLWLDPRNAIVIAQHLVTHLSQLAPQSADQFQRNFEEFKLRTQALDSAIARSLEPVQHEGFAVYHEGYAHFVARYQLHQVGYITYTPERRPGARHLKELNNVLKEEGKCLFTEPHASDASTQKLAHSLNLRIGLLDPIGIEASTYGELLGNMREQFLTCLANRVH